MKIWNRLQKQGQVPEYFVIKEQLYYFLFLVIFLTSLETGSIKVFIIPFIETLYFQPPNMYSNYGYNTTVLFIILCKLM